MDGSGRGERLLRYKCKHILNDVPENNTQKSDDMEFVSANRNSRFCK